MDMVFQGVFDSGATSMISVGNFMLCMIAALVIGVILAGTHMQNARYTKSFVMTLILLPTVVCVVIMMVNGNVGAGVAVAGAFSLVRFRSVPGTAKEITMLFLAMGAGLICGMGYIGFAVLFAVLMCICTLLCNRIDFGERKHMAKYKTVNITVPEDLDYSGVFENLFAEYTSSCELIRVKTTNMGSLFRLTYDIVLEDVSKEKEMIDKLRCRNGNLEITVSRQETTSIEL